MKSYYQIKKDVLEVHSLFWESYAKRDIDLRFSLCSDDVTFCSAIGIASFDFWFGQNCRHDQPARSPKTILLQNAEKYIGYMVELGWDKWIVLGWVICPIY